MEPWQSDLLKIAIPALLGFVFGRLSKRLDRRQDKRDKEAAARADWDIKHSRGGLYTLTNYGSDATNVQMSIGGGGIMRPAGGTFKHGHTESFSIQHRGDGTIHIAWKDHRGNPDDQTFPIPSSPVQR